MHLGTAFQIADDVLDYDSSSQSMGKNVGDDLAEGKTTLPLIHAMREGTAEQRSAVAAAISEGGLEALPAVLEAIESTDALQWSMKRARDFSELAVEALSVVPVSPYREALERIARYSVERDH